MSNLDGLFYPALFSPDIGLTKGDREIFDRAQKMVGYEPYQLLMIDDSMANLKSAKVAGWRILHYRHPDSLREKISGFNILK